ncbi:MAG: biotin--[acetyl-CoA-carboxylase] ligase [Thermodesulfobacteriota bacterium]
MGVTTTLSAARIEQFIRAEEIGLRNQSFPLETVLAVFRYGAPIASTIQRHDKLERGMAHAKSLILDHEESGCSFPSGLVITANELTDSRGRFRRYWHAPTGGLWMTAVLVNTLLPASTALYSLAPGVAACETIREDIPGARLKWINDVHVGGRKICGILVETMRGASGEEYILLGVGINVNNEQFPKELADLAVSYKQLLGYEMDVNRLAVRFLAKLSWNIGLLHYEEERILAEHGRDALDDPARLAEVLGGKDHLLVKRWRQLSDTEGRRVRFGHNVQEKPQFEATVKAINGDASIILELDDGSTVTENSGEIVYLD